MGRAVRDYRRTSRVATEQARWAVQRCCAVGDWITGIPRMSRHSWSAGFRRRAVQWVVGPAAYSAHCDRTGRR
eukprot:15456183-Alexandrium_andersonii.AAC.1